MNELEINGEQQEYIPDISWRDGNESAEGMILTTRVILR